MRNTWFKSNVHSGRVCVGCVYQNVNQLAKRTTKECNCLLLQKTKGKAKNNISSDHIERGETITVWNVEMEVLSGKAVD